MNESSIVPALATLFPIVAGLSLFYIAEYINLRMREIIAIGTCAITFILIASLYPTIAGGGIVESSLRFFAAPLPVYFRMDGLDFFLAAIASFLWLITTIYSPGYLGKHPHARSRYYSFLLMALGGCIGVFSTGNLLGLFIFFEFMAITTYVLIAHEEDVYAMFAANKYLYLTIAAGLAVFFGMIIVYFDAGTVSFSDTKIVSEVSGYAFIAFLAFLLGFGIKAGMFPVHVWLPDAHPAAPAPASALLSGVMIKTGAYGLIRVFMNIFSPEFFAVSGTYLSGINWADIVTVIATITILLGSALAILQDGLKRRLAYSSIAQIGYILLGISLLSETALVGSIYHIFTHAFMKGCLFLCAGLIIVQTGKKNISQLRGIGFKMPITMLCFTIASLSMVGIPPFNGFISKWQLCMGALAVDRPFFVALLIVSSLLNSIYYFPIVINAFFSKDLSGEDGHGDHGHHGSDHHDSHPAHNEGKKGFQLEAPWSMLIPTIILAVGCFIFALTPVNWPLELAKSIAQSLF